MFLLRMRSAGVLGVSSAAFGSPLSFDLAIANASASVAGIVVAWLSAPTVSKEARANPQTTFSKYL